MSCLYTHTTTRNIGDADRAYVTVIRINVYQQRDEIRKYSFVQTWKLFVEYRIQSTRIRA